MLKMVIFDCVINEKCCSVDGGRGHLPSFIVPTPGDLTAQVSLPPGIYHSRQKEMLMSGGGVGGWAQLELTDA